MKHTLTVANLGVRYGAVTAVRNLSFTVRPGEIIALNGPNGAGKSSTVMSIVGGTVGAQTTGSITYGDHELIGMTPEAISNLGIACVPEGRRIFTTLTVQENLLIAAHQSQGSPAFKAGMDEVVARFPALGEYRMKPAGLLSGGQLQQLALGRALIRKPDLMVIDEPSIGLSPNLVTEILKVIAELRDEGTAIVLVEQNAQRARAMADQWVEVDKGSIKSSSTSQGEVIPE